ncbi:MAG: ribbon-helix-helix protein, CopG family [Actinobacteria bacterium]|nr:ribbon-helix-helix protein, CopG family [Actinomycetota bacterium]
MARRQVLLQLSDELLVALDRQAERRRVSRSQVVREAVERYTHDEREAEIDRNIVEGYTRIPQEPDPISDFFTMENMRALDEEERKAGHDPW